MSINLPPIPDMAAILAPHENGNAKVAQFYSAVDTSTHGPRFLTGFRQVPDLQ
jgi:hypothetical protein